jgi:hypothetical protein
VSSVPNPVLLQNGPPGSSLLQSKSSGYERILYTYIYNGRMDYI